MGIARKSFNCELREIQSLCTALANCHREVSSLGFLACQNDFRHELYSAPHCSSPCFSGGNLSLYDILCQSCNTVRALHTGKGFKLSRKERMSLALHISTSLLQLYATPWISKDWSKKDIVFQKVNSPSQVNIYQPYLRRQFSTKLATSLDSTDIANDTQAIMFRLGVLLLELCTGEALENQLSDSDENVNTASHRSHISEFAAVHDWWARDARDEEGEDYAEAIRKCIQFDFPTEFRSLRDEEFIIAVYNCVVQPIAGVASKFKI